MKVSILSLLRLLFVCSAIWTNCTDFVKSAVVPGSVNYQKPCERDTDCKTYSAALAHRPLCDKFNRTLGVCGCTGEFFKISKYKHLINPRPPEVLGYIETFFNKPNKIGCHREVLRGATCDKDASNCNQAGIPPDSGGKQAVICRNINVDESGIIGVEDWRCVGHPREIKTFGNCGYPKISGQGYGLPNIVFQCDAIFTDAECLATSATFPGTTDVQACVPKGSTIKPEDYFCHHDTDCKDPNAVCKFAFKTTSAKKETFHRHLCVCDEDAGFMFKIVAGKVKCKQGSRIHEICREDEDCGILKSYECKEFGDSHVKTCQCQSKYDEYFEGATEADADCWPVKDYGVECRPFWHTNRNKETVHECRRQSKTKTHFTGLVCPVGVSNPTCVCRKDSKWNMVTDGKCVPVYADLDQPCDPKGGNGLLKCNPRSHLKCKEKDSGSKKFTCFCDEHSDRDADFAYCKPRVQSKGYGEDCDENTMKCNPELNLICNVGKCECISDEHIKDKPKTKECRYEKPGPDGKKGAASTYSSPGFSAIYLVLTTAYILLYS